jgi:acylphosphatase
LEEAVRRRVMVRGQVQGVGFRATTRSEAARVGASGWVRNRPDGSVEAVFEGPAPAVAAMVAFCRRGPSFARVDRIEVAEESPEGLRGFAVR